MADDDLLGSGIPAAYTPTGEYIPEAQLSQHIAKGTADFRPGGMVPMVAPDGSIYQVPSESAMETLRNGEGWQLDTPEQQRVRKLREASDEHPILGGIAAGASEAADVASFGQTAAVRAATSKASKALGVGDGRMASDIEQIKQDNPIATGIGTVGGALLGGTGGASGKLLAGGAEAIGMSRLAGALSGGAAGESGLLARSAASATRFGATGAAEGAGYAGGMETARQIRGVGDKDIAVEKILMEAAKGGAFGGAFGGLLGGAGRLGGDAIGRVASKGLNAEAQALKAIGGTDAQIAKFIKTRPPDQRASIISHLMNEPDLIKPFKKLEDVAEQVEKIREKTGNEIGSFLKKIDDIPWYSAVPSRNKMASQVEDLISELRSKNVGPDVALAKELQNDWLPGLLKANTAEEIQQFRIRFDKYKSAVYRREQDQAKDAYYRKFRDIVESGLEEDIQKTVDKLAMSPHWTPDHWGVINEYQKLKAKQQAFIVAEDDFISKALANEQAGRGGIGMGDVVRTTAGFVGATAHGLAGLPAFGIGLAGDAAWRAVKSRSASAILARAADKLRGGLDASTGRLSSAVGQSLVSGAKNLTQALPAATGKVLLRYQESSKVAQQARANPPVAVAKVERAVAPLAEVDPELASKMAIKLQGDLKWLTDKLPPPGTPSVFSTKDLPGAGKKGKGGRKGGSSKEDTFTTEISTKGSATTTRMSISAMSQFNRAERAIDRPLEAIADMKNGRLAPETVEMLRDRRPHIRDQIKNEMVAKLSEMSERGKVPSRTMRVQMSLITGEPADATMNPAFIKSVQSFWDEERAKSNEPPQTPPRRETSRGMRDRAKSLRSAGDDVEDDIA